MKSQPKIFQNNLRDTNRTEKFEDNPIIRQQVVTLDRLSGDVTNSMANLRLKALQSSGRTTNIAIRGQSNWVQVGPTATTGGGTISSYYYWKGLLPFDQRKEVLVTGRVTAIIVDPFDQNSNTIYLGSALGGVWKTSDGGRNWTPTSDDADSLAIGAIAMDPQNRYILYAGTGEGNFSGDSYYGMGVIKTIDGGKTWKSCGDDQRDFFINSRFCRLVINPSVTTTLFAAVRSSQYSRSASGIFRSKDSGTNWTKLDNGIKDTTGIGATDIAINPKDPNIAYAAIYNDGIYKTTEANTNQPLWIKQNLPGFSPVRTCLAISPSYPEIVFALASDDNEDIKQLYRTSNAGETWERIDISISKNTSPWGDGNIGGQGSYNLHISVDPVSPDIVYLGSISLWKAIRNTSTNTWQFIDIGKAIHPDQHAFAVDPNNPFIIFAGNDGGIYKSIDAGETWTDTINEGLCITQFEFMSNHPNSDAVAFAGAQDNGTLQYRNNSVFCTADGGDGGYVVVDPMEPYNVIHQYIRTSLYHSKQAGKKDSWIPIYPPSDSPAYFYAPFALDQSNTNNIAFGASNKIIFDKNQGLAGWSTSKGDLDSVNLSGMTVHNPLQNNTDDWITALNYVNSNLIYVGTNRGKIFRITKSGENWNKPLSIHSSTMPSHWIWDIASIPGKESEIVVVMAGFRNDVLKGSHVWYGTISADGQTKWEDINPRNENGEIINIPVNCISIDEDPSMNIHDMYIGTDIGVFKSTNSGKNWTIFNQGLPNCAIYDMRIQYKPVKLLRLVTHGRGMWERRLDVSTLPAVDLFVRDHLMDTGRSRPSDTWSNMSPDIRAGFEDSFQDEDPDLTVQLGAALRWYMCPDIKIDVSKGENSYQMEVEDVDYVKFETKLYNRSAKRAHVNRVYVQIHNRGIQSANEKVTVKLLYADLTDSAIDVREYRDLPKDLWTTFAGHFTDNEYWKSVGEAKFLPSGPKTLSNTEPTILEWDWNIPRDVGDNLWLLVIVDSTEDPIPDSSKVFDLYELVRNEKRAAVRLINVTS